MLNEVILMGRLTAEPEMKHTKQGNIPVLSFSIAVDREYVANGERETDFINVTAWRGTADFIQKYFHKGMMMIVIGSLRNQRWQDDDGSNHSRLEVVAEKVKFGETKKSRESR